MRYLVPLIFLLSATLACAQEWEDRRVFSGAAATTELRILSSTDTDYLAPMIDAYIAVNPDVSVDYLVVSTAQIAQIIRQQPGEYDVVISSAMDLQIQLVNDGFAAAMNDVSSPDWAQWRSSLFGFTYEPAAIVVNKDAFSGRPLPQSRQDLITLLREKPEVFDARIGTYDVRRSGLGYLFATQDARTSETYWRLTEVMGGLNPKLYCCSGDMIDDVASGKLIVAYNVLGSYAQGRSDLSDKIDVVFPSDFTTTMMRTAFVTEATGNKAKAGDFLKALLKTFAASSDDQSRFLPPLVLGSAEIQQTVIPLEPSLLVYLDRLKKETFIAEWESALIR